MSTPFLRATVALFTLASSLGQSDATRPGQSGTPETHVISGKIIDSRGLPPTGVVVQVTAPEPNGSASLFTIPIAPNGAFETQPLPPGQYRFSR